MNAALRPPFRHFSATISTGDDSGDAKLAEGSFMENRGVIMNDLHLTRNSKC